MRKSLAVALLATLASTFTISCDLLPTETKIRYRDRVVRDTVFVPDTIYIPEPDDD